MLDQAALPWFAELNRSLLDELDDEGFRTRIKQNTALLETLATQIVARARILVPSLETRAIDEILGCTGKSGPALLFSLAA
jgi:hypothetical protein